MSLQVLPQALEPSKPKGLERLDTAQAAKMCGIPMVEFINMWKQGHITDKYVRKDPETKHWFVYRCDIPDLQAEIAAHKPGTLKVVLEGDKGVSMTELAARTGLSIYQIKKFIDANNITPSRVTRRSAPGNPYVFYHTKLVAELIEAQNNAPVKQPKPKVIKLKKADPRFPTFPEGYISVRATADACGVPIKDIYNLMAKRTHWPADAKTIRVERALGVPVVAVPSIKQALTAKKYARVSAPVDMEKYAAPYKPIPIAQHVDVDWFALASEMHAAGHADAAVWLVKTKL